VNELDETIHAAIVELRRLTEVFGHRRRELAHACGITEQQWRILEEIASEHFIPSMFAREAESSPAAVSKVLRQLLEKSLVTVSVSPDDGRQRTYELTESGHEVMRELRRRRQRAIVAIWREFDGTTLDDFIQFGRTLSERLEAYREDGIA